MPTFKRLLGLVAFGCLPACFGPGGAQINEAPSQIIVTKAEIAVAGPQGFCVDTTTTRAKAKSAYVVLASCGSVSNKPLAVKPDFPAILTVSIAEGQLATEGELKTYFASPAGVARLRKTSAIEEIAFETDDGAFFVSASSGTNTYWRGFMALGTSHVATLTIETPLSVTNDPDRRFSVLRDLSNRLRALNTPRALAQRQAPSS